MWFKVNKFNDKPKLRLAKQEDINGILEIEKACFALEICESEEVFLERIDVFCDGFYVLEINHQIIGYISTELWDYRAEINPNIFELGHSIKEVHTLLGNELYISSMGLLPQYRGNGLGSLLFEDSIRAIQKKFTQINFQVLIVSEEWKKAVNIYKGNNFKEIMRLENFFEFNNHKESALVMRKEL